MLHQMYPQVIFKRLFSWLRHKRWRKLILHVIILKLLWNLLFSFSITPSIHWKIECCCHQFNIFFMHLEIHKNQTKYSKVKILKLQKTKYWISKYCKNIEDSFFNFLVYSKKFIVAFRMNVIRILIKESFS